MAYNSNEHEWSTEHLDNLKTLHSARRMKHNICYGERKSLVGVLVAMYQSSTLVVIGVGEMQTQIIMRFIFSYSSSRHKPQTCIPRGKWSESVTTKYPRGGEPGEAACSSSHGRPREGSSTAISSNYSDIVPYVHDPAQIPHLKAIPSKRKAHKELTILPPSSPVRPCSMQPTLQAPTKKARYPRHITELQVYKHRNWRR